MAGLDERHTHLEVEIANEAQWVVFDDPSEEEPWATLELEEFELAATWWVSIRR